MKSDIENLIRQIHEKCGTSGGTEFAKFFAEYLTARVYVALRLGHEKLWRKTSGLADPFGPAGALPAALRDEVRDLLSKGRKLDAIKKMREAVADLGLKEAKDIVDHLDGELP